MKSKILNVITTLLIGLFFTNCESNSHDYPPLDKRYWTVEDFEKAANQIMYAYNPDEELPTFKNPETKPILDKLLDTQNFIVILSDSELGLKYRNETGQSFFQIWRNLSNSYSALDRKDKYIYENEHIALSNYGLELQLYYFKIGNEEILSSSEDPESTRLQNVINSNVETLIDNYIIHLDDINDEDSYSENGKKQLAERINKYFSRLVNENPDADFSNLKRKSELFIKKTNNNEIKTSLENLIELINSKSKKDEEIEQIENSDS